MPHSISIRKALSIFAAAFVTMTLRRTGRVSGFLAGTEAFTRSTGANNCRQRYSRRVTMSKPSNAKTGSGALFAVAQDESTDTDTLSMGMWAGLLSGAQHALAALERDASAYSMMKFNEDFLFNTTAPSSGGGGGPGRAPQGPPPR